MAYVLMNIKMRINFSMFKMSKSRINTDEILTWLKGHYAAISYVTNYVYQAISNVRPKWPWAKLIQGRNNIKMKQPINHNTRL